MNSDEQNASGGGMDFSADAFRKLGYRVIDLMAEVLASQACDPIMVAVTGKDVRGHFSDPPPREGLPPVDVLRQVQDAMLTGVRRNGHPRFLGYVVSSADPIGVLADALASALNQNVTSWRSAPTSAEMERQVVHWLDEMVGFGGSGHGMLVSGGSAANATAIGCALANTPRGQAVAYVSREGHLSLAKAARTFGVPDEQIRRIGVDAARRMVVTDLERQIVEDLRVGLRPACVCVSAGTTNTGPIDPLDDAATVYRTPPVSQHSGRQDTN